MEQLLEAIRAAVAPDASEETKTAGAAACRMILAALEPSSSAQALEPRPPDPNIAALATAIRGMPMDHLLDLAIAKLRSALPATAAVPQVERLNIPLIRAPRS